MKLHERFTNIHKGVLRATELLVYGHPTATIEDDLERFQSWAEVCATAYNIGSIRVSMPPEGCMRGPGGAYAAEAESIWLTTPSLMMLFHQFRHFWQEATNAECAHDHMRSEMDAQGWACSLLHAVAPQLYRTMVFELAVPGVAPADLANGPEQAPRTPPAARVAVPLSEAEALAFEELADGLIESLQPDEDLTALMQQIADEGHTEGDE